MPVTLEKTDPELGELLKWWCNEREFEGKIKHGRVMTAGTYYRGESKIGRNEPCPCGSGRKYKKCCRT